MKIKNAKNNIGLAVLLGIVVLAISAPMAFAQTEIQSPELPAVCSNLQVEAGNEVYFKTYAIGVQIYRWNGTSWVLNRPDANLYAAANYRGKVGTHYFGPTWESNSGSKVVGSVQARCTPDSTAVQWLLLQAAPTEDPGIFSKATYIQRVNTTGGLAPTTPGIVVGEEKGIPYTAEYYFYKETE